MAEEVKKTENKEAAEKIVVELSTPYTFEGQEYTEIDITKIQEMTIKDAIDIQSQLFSEQEVAGMVVSETTTAFTRALAAKASGLPIEFFKLAPRNVSRKISQTVRGFINTENNTEHHVMRFEKPYHFKGKTYETVDLSGVANMNSMNESEAENRMAVEGFIITENSLNYLYSCIIASMATNLPEEFFTGLPIKETLKLKNAVNDADFFG